jgi:hypothetical protein
VVCGDGFDATPQHKDFSPKRTSSPPPRCDFPASASLPPPVVASGYKLASPAKRMPKVMWCCLITVLLVLLVCSELRTLLVKSVTSQKAASAGNQRLHFVSSPPFSAEQHPVIETCQFVDVFLFLSDFGALLKERKLVCTMNLLVST